MLLDLLSTIVGGMLTLIRELVVVVLIIVWAATPKKVKAPVRPPTQCPFTFNKEEIGCMECGNYTLCEAERVGRFEKLI